MFASMFESQQRMNERLIALQERDRVAKEQKDQWDGDTRLQIKQTIRKITATDSETLWQQFEDWSVSCFRIIFEDLKLGTGISS